MELLYFYLLRPNHWRAASPYNTRYAIIKKDDQYQIRIDGKVVGNRSFLKDAIGVIQTQHNAEQDL
jgi:hypothetical protein